MATTTARTAEHPLSIRRLAHDYQWIHTCIGVVGNTLFVIGSVLFLWESTKRIGVWLFIVGTVAMLIGSVGAAIVKLAPVDDD